MRLYSSDTLVFDRKDGIKQQYFLYREQQLASKWKNITFIEMNQFSVHVIPKAFFIAKLCQPFLVSIDLEFQLNAKSFLTKVLYKML
jgi:hypothetical protein